MGPLLITILLGLTSLSIQKSVKSNNPQESIELEAFLQNVLSEGRDRYTNDVNLKINVNRNKKKAKDNTKIQYLGEISSEKEKGFKKLNKKLAKLLDGLQKRVMHEDTKDPTCSCDYASERWPGVLKCQCGDLRDGDDEDKQGPREAERDDDSNDEYYQDHKLDEIRNKKHEDRREDRSDEDVNDEYSQLTRFRNDNRCGCTLLRSTGDDIDLTLYLRCRICESPARIGDDKEDREEGYYSGNNRCGCQLLRNTDGNNELRCRICESPASRDGDYQENKREEGYSLGNNRCGCELLRNIDDDKDIQYLRCRCNSPERAGSKDDRDDGYWTDDTSCGCDFMRNADGNKELRCRICGTPPRIDDGKENDREEEYMSRNSNSPERAGSQHDGYWTDDTSCGCDFMRNADGNNELRCRICESPTSRVGDYHENNREGGYSLGNNRCGCELLRNVDDDQNTHYLRCRCNSPERAGSKDDRDDGYWTDDTSCGCDFMRNSNGNNELRCRICESPARIGDDREEGYWSDDNYCACTLLRNTDDAKNIKNLRCRCNSPLRDIHFNSFRSIPDNIGLERFGTILSDLSDADFKNYESKHLDRNLDKQKLNSVLNFILKKDDNIDLSNLPSMKRKVLIKLRDIMPPLRNVDANKLQDKIASIIDGNVNQLREKIKQKSDMENPLTAQQLQRLLNIIEQQKKMKDKNQMYRRNMPEEPIGVPFTYQFKGLAQINP